MGWGLVVFEAALRVEALQWTLRYLALAPGFASRERDDVRVDLLRPGRDGQEDAAERECYVGSHLLLATYDIRV